MASPEINSAKTVPAKLVLEHVSKWFQTSSLKVHALDDVTLHIAEGEFVCLVGPSGCGKSTLLNIIAGLERPDHGVVRPMEKPSWAPRTSPPHDVSGGSAVSMADRFRQRIVWLEAQYWPERGGATGEG
jgi:ABC-type oligopeptide transport system ATPase subunit